METVFVDPERCIGCLQCEIACAVEHSISQDVTWAFLETPIPRYRVHIEAGPVAGTSFPNKCRHCDPAPCQRVCPAGAISRDESGDLVLVDVARCIGCAMCAVVCPFDAVTFHPLAGAIEPTANVAVKCDGCVARVARGDQPACVESCKVGALVFGEMDDLVRTGRIRESVAVLAAASAHPSAEPEADVLGGWRSFGEERLRADQRSLDRWTHLHTADGKESANGRN